MISAESLLSPCFIVVRLRLSTSDLTRLAGFAICRGKDEGE